MRLLYYNLHLRSKSQRIDRLDIRLILMYALSGKQGVLILTNVIFMEYFLKSYNILKSKEPFHIRRYSQGVRQRSATPLSPVQIWVAPPCRYERSIVRTDFFCNKKVSTHQLRCTSFAAKSHASYRLTACKRAVLTPIYSLPTFCGFRAFGAEGQSVPVY